MTDLQHLQKVILDITKYIDQLCKENGIEYYLEGGTCIGAIRHKGFIPWDDDLDIIMDSENYDKFIKVCREKLDTSKYYFQESYVDWPMPFSKIKLLGTVFEEPSMYYDSPEHRGIFVDIFRLENVSNSKIGQKWQYFCGEVFLCYCLSKRGFDNPSLKKKLLIAASFPLKVKCIRNFFKKQVERYRNKKTDYVGMFGGRYRLHNAIYKRSEFCNPVRVPFEDTMLPVPSGYDAILTQIFGDYMTPPPVKEQVGLHLSGVDFGKY